MYRSVEPLETGWRSTALCHSWGNIMLDRPEDRGAAEAEDYLNEEMDSTDDDVRGSVWWLVIGLLGVAGIAAGSVAVSLNTPLAPIG